jgi:chorismate mutase/prephenate dehydratase
VTRPEIPTGENDSLADLRARIDALDVQIARLLQERADLSRRVGQTKNGGQAAPIFVPHREAEVLANVQAVRGPLDENALAAIYRLRLGRLRELNRRPGKRSVGSAG